MEKITVWTKQHENVAKILETEGRYIARRAYIQQDLEEHADLVLEVYDWLVKNGPNANKKPADVTYPVWVSTIREATMLPSPGTIILELEIDADQITKVNIDKWGAILNYSYIPADKADDQRHQKLLADYGISDPKAYMSQFYPGVKREIIASWSRLFDDSIILGNDNYYGNIWEVRREWVKQIIK